MKKQLVHLVQCAGIALILAALLMPGTGSLKAQDPTAGAGRLVLLSKLDGPPLPEGLRVLEEYGDALVLADLTDAQLAALPEANVYDRLAGRTTLSLNGLEWDTSQGEPAVAESLRSAPDDPYFLVQFYAPVREAWKAELEAMGVTFLGYHPNYTYLVRMDPALAGLVRAAHAVQWVGRYHPAYRLASEEELAQAVIAPDGRLTLFVRGFPDTDPASLQAELERSGASIWRASGSGLPLVHAWADRDLLPRLAALPGVYRIEPYTPVSMENDKVVQTSHAWEVWKQGRSGLAQDLMGAGQTAGNLDSGLDNNSTSPSIEDFYDRTGNGNVSRVLSNSAGIDCGLCGGSCESTDSAVLEGHGTHTSGSIVGNGYNSLAQRGLTAHATAADPFFDYAWAAGMAPEAYLRVVHVGESNGGLCIDAAADWNTLYSYGANPARVTNNSWGSSSTNYGGDSISADYRMWGYQDYLLVVAAGNSGPTAGQIQQPANAKNIISVGASTNHRSVLGPYLQYADTTQVLASFSALGPTTSGRFKPDLVAPGARVLSTRSGAIAATTSVGWGNDGGMDGGDGDGDNDSLPDYAYMGGTSMAAPQVTGAALLARDYFQDVQGMGTTTPPSAALLKAALLNGAVDMGFGYEANSSAPYGGRNMQGWGYLNVEQAIAPKAPRSFFFDDFTSITGSAHQSTMGTDGTGDYVQYTVSVVDGSEPLKVTLTWTDRQNLVDGTLVNNLNLLVTPPSGPAYYGNRFSGAWSNTTASYDTVNTTEAVYVQSPGTGTWTIRVTDGSHGGGTQPFAIMVSGGLGPNPSWTRACSGTLGTCANARGGTTGQSYGGVARNYQPSLLPLSLAEEHVAPGAAATASFRLTNWGRSSDTLNLSYAVTDQAGGAAGGIAVTFSPAGPFALASGASQDVVASLTVGSGTAEGSYDVAVTATSGSSGQAAGPDGVEWPTAVSAGAAVTGQLSAVADPVPSASTLTGDATIADPGSRPAPSASASAERAVYRQDVLVFPLNAMADGSLSGEARVVDEPGPQVTPDLWATAGSTEANSVLWATYLSGESHVNGHGEVVATCSADGGLTWTAPIQVDAGDGALYYKPVVAGSSAGTSVTFVWVKPHLAVYARTLVVSGCSVTTTRAIQTLASYPSDGGRRVKYPDVVYDTGGRILATWQMVTSSTSATEGIFSAYSTTDGASYSAAAAVADASGTDATHNMPQLVLDTANDDVWMAYAYAASATNYDIRLKRWRAGTWQAGTSTAAGSGAIETRPGIGYVSATGSLWVTWHRYALTTTASDAQARLYYVRTTGTLPSVTFGTTYQYPTGIRTAEEHPAMVVGDGTFSYITYLAQSDSFRGGNVYALKVPAAGGAPSTTCQLSNTADDPPLYARGNAGAPSLMWATTQLRPGETPISGPALLYSKNPAGDEDPDYSANLGASQTLYNLEENLDLYLCQVCQAAPTSVDLKSLEAWLEGAAIHVRWETSHEIDNLGFNLYRSNTRTGPKIRLNEALIPTQAPPGSPFGAVYDWIDSYRLRSGRRYFYWLEDVDVYGHTTMHGPVRVAFP